MTLALAMIVFGVVLLDSAITNRSLVDTALGRQGDPLSSGGGSSSGTPSQGGTATPGQSLHALSAAGGKAASGTEQFDGHPVAKWIVPILKWARRNGWHGTVTSGYRSRAEQQAIWDSGVRPAAKPGTSNHEKTRWPGGAVDVSSNDELERVLRHYPGILKIKRDPSIGDPVHFSASGR